MNIGEGILNSFKLVTLLNHKLFTYFFKKGKFQLLFTSWYLKFIFVQPKKHIFHDLTCAGKKDG